MLTIPTTGTTYDGAGFNDLDNRFLERGKLRQVLIRDARGSATDLTPHNSDGSQRWTPFADDGTWRPDLLAFQKINGIWQTNTVQPNEGFHIAGAFKDGAGPSQKPTVKNDNFLIVQSNFPFDSDIVEEGEPFSFIAVETAKPLIRRLRNNLALNDSSGNALVEEPGLLPAGWAKPLDQDNVDRQVLLISQFNKEGLPIYTVDGFNLAKLDNIGPSKKDKKDSEAAELTYMPLPDGIFMAMQDGVYLPILKYTWVGGTGWTQIAGTTQWLVTLGTQTSGTFTLNWGIGGATTAIAYNATNATVKAALVALDDGYGASSWSVTGSAGGPYTITPPQPTAVTGSGASLGTPGTFAITPVAP